MADAWAKQKGETSKSFGSFCDFLQMGPARTVRACAEQFGHRIQSLNTWSSRHKWIDRAAAYDVQELANAAAKHEQTRARIRQKLMDGGEAMADVALSVAAGRVSDPCICEDREPGEPCTCGAWTAIRDREGNYIGDRPLVSASTRGVAAFGILDRNGITVPKRVELTGADGDALRLDARLSMATLDDSKLAALLAAFAPDAADASDD